MARTKRQETAEPFTAKSRNPQLTAMAAVAEKFKAWRPAHEVLTAVRAVPTIFPQYDRATRVGGHPIERWTTVHGPSNHGKTSWCHGLGLSFLQRDHFYAFVDAEYTSPEDWLAKMMAEYAHHPGFIALRPTTYEQTVDAVREVMNGVAEARGTGAKNISDETSLLIVVDSLRKLVPEDILAKIKQHGAQGKRGSVDGMGGRAAQVKAAMNASWLDEMTPGLFHKRAAMVAIARESEDTGADANDKMYGNDWKMTGGKAIEFDASLVIRITRAAWVKDGAGEDSRIVGERHRMTIRKTKVAGKDDKNVVCYFHTSNGVLAPEGFDRARDVLEMARGYGMVASSGTWLSWRGNRWQGESAAVKKLHLRPELLATLEQEVRAKFAPTEKLEQEVE